MYKPETEFVFYLMGECANESIGLKIKGLKVVDKVHMDDVEQGTMTWNV